METKQKFAATDRKIQISRVGYSGGREYAATREGARAAALAMLARSDAFVTVQLKAVVGNRSHLIGEVGRLVDWLETDDQIDETFTRLLVR